MIDNAPSHKSRRLSVPEGIEIKYLLPYSPDLNPVERFFQEIKREIKNKSFKSLEELENWVVQILNKFNSQKLISLTFYPYIRKALGYF